MGKRTSVQFDGCWSEENYMVTFGITSMTALMAIRPLARIAAAKGGAVVRIAPSWTTVTQSGILGSHLGRLKEFVEEEKLRMRGNQSHGSFCDIQFQIIKLLGKRWSENTMCEGRVYIV